jgi:hypothetical protein
VLGLTLAVAALAVLFLVAGAPLAVSIESSRVSLSGLIVDSLLLGVALTTVGIVLTEWWGTVGAIAVGGLWLVAAAHALRTRGLRLRLQRPTRQGVVLGAVWTAVITLTVLLRVRPANFLPWVADMGAYVNWGNELARTGVLAADWPPLFPAFLSISSRVFGPELVTAGVAFAGVLLVLLVARLLQTLRLGAWSILVTTLLASLSVHAVWYSSMPTSEGLAAPLLLGWVGCLIGLMRGDARARPWLLVSTGLLMLALGLLRGTGPLLLAPLLVLAVVQSLVADWRTAARGTWGALAASVLGAAVAYFYGIQQIPDYYVDLQIAELLPARVFAGLDSAGVFAAGVTSGLMLVGVVAAVAFAARVGLLMAWSQNAEVYDVLARAGLWASLGLIVTTVAIPRLDIAVEAKAVLVLAGLTSLTFLPLHHYRLGQAREHSFFLYWDRYAFSEVIPLTLVAVGIGLDVAYRAVSRQRERLAISPATRLPVDAVAAGLLLVAVVAPSLPDLRLATKHSSMEGTFEFVAELVSLVPDEQLPVLWSSTAGEMPPEYFFPNTRMAFGKPMQHSFGLDVVNIGGFGFEPDDVLTDADLVHVARCRRSARLVVFETDLGEPTLTERVSTPDVRIQSLGDATSDMKSLRQQPARKTWDSVRFTVNAWLVEVDTARLRSGTCGGDVPRSDDVRGASVAHPDAPEPQRGLPARYGG